MAPSVHTENASPTQLVQRLNEQYEKVADDSLLQADARSNRALHACCNRVTSSAGAQSF